MDPNHGRFIWYELITKDPEAAKRFYGEVVGWTSQEMPGLHGPYNVMNAAGNGVAGIMGFPPAEGDAPPEGEAEEIPASWAGYILSDDPDTDARRIESLGGDLIRRPEDIPGIGRFAIGADPGGAAFAIMAPAPMETPRPDVAPGTPGHVGWHELYAEVLEREWRFYDILFEWKQDEAMDMGEMGPYQLFSTPDGQVGGMMKKPEHLPQGAWVFYFNVETLDAAVGRVNSAGGKVLNGPMEVPGGAWVVQCQDPQGAMFALVAPKR